MKRIWRVVLLFSSAGTLVCCALPAAFVALGLGSVFAGLVSRVPQLVWLSEHKGFLFGVAAGSLAVGAAMQYRARSRPCPAEAKLADACRETRRWTGPAYWIAAGLLVIGASFAFGPQLLGWA